MIMNRYNQVPHLTWNTIMHIWESDKTQETSHTREPKARIFITRLQGTDIGNIF